MSPARPDGSAARHAIFEARRYLAMSRVLASIDAEQANEYALQAWDSAYTVGCSQCALEQAPAMFLGEPHLVDGWEFGQARALETASSSRRF